jgi:translation initiation factor IF-2
MKRIYEAAKELRISSKAMLRLLRKLGFEATSPMAPISKEMMDKCVEHFEKDKEKVKIREVEKRKIRNKVPKSTYEKLKDRHVKEKERAEKKLKQTMTKIDMGPRTKKYKRETKPGQEEPLSKIIKLAQLTSVRELASFLRIDPLDLLAKCLKLGVTVTINQRLDFETASTVASEYGFETELTSAYEEKEDVKEEVVEKTDPRHPVVTVMGHVDHGKTTLLDYIRHTDVAGSETGKITQHIGAYKIEAKKGHYITFVDTPGHHAFTAMRTRGAKITDIVLLILAADEGVKPQTVEAMNHAKDAGVPIILVLNKIDLPTADPDKTEKQLLEHELVTEKFGGEVLCCRVSAKTGAGVKELLETVIMQAELLELRTSVKASAKGTIIESKLDKGRGPIASAIIHQGILKVGDPILAGSVSGKVRALYDEWGKTKDEVGSSDPIQIVGLDNVPQVGDTLQVIKDEKLAREISKKRKIHIREETARWRKPIVEDIQNLQIDTAKELKLIIKGDVAGSAEALSDALHHVGQKVETEASDETEEPVIDEVKVNVIHQGAGVISESDVLLAAASGAMILGFNTKENTSAARLAKEKGVEIRTYGIIYEAIEDIELAVKGLLPPKIEKYELGKAQIKQVFKISKLGFIAGCQVTEGKIVRGEQARVKRDDAIIFEGKIESLKRVKDSVKEVQEGVECGIGFGESIKLEPGDIIEVHGSREIPH